MLENVNPSKTAAWKKLKEHFKVMEFVQMQDLFASNSKRAEEFHILWDSLLLDFSKNKITSETLNLLLELAEEVKLKEAIDKLICGSKINVTEDRAVLHTAARSFSGHKTILDGGFCVSDFCN